MQAVYAFKSRLPEWEAHVRRSDEAWRRYRSEECELSLYETFEGGPSVQKNDSGMFCIIHESVKRIDDLAYYSLNTPTYLSDH